MSRVAAAVALASLVACSSSLYQSYVSASQASPPDAYACVVQQLTAMGYQRTHYEPSRRWYVGARPDPDASVSSVQFRKRLDVLDVTVSPDSSGQARLAIKASTQDEYSNQRGLDRQEIAASPRVKADARQLAESCAVPTPAP